MSLLNAKLNQFNLWFPRDFFPTDVMTNWKDVIKRNKLPYDRVDDFVNNCIQSVTFPSISVPVVTQQNGQYVISKKTGKELEPILNKEFTVTFKLSEGMYSYWIWFEVIENFLKYGDNIPFFNNANLTFMDNNGLSTINFQFKEIIPINVSSLDFNYARTLADFSTFTITFVYNRFEIVRDYSTRNSE